MRRLTFSRPAREDFFQIWFAIAPDNEPAADSLIEHLLKIARIATDLPGLGRMRNDLPGALRSVAVDAYVPLPTAFELRASSTAAATSRPSFNNLRRDILSS